MLNLRKRDMQKYGRRAIGIAVVAQFLPLLCAFVISDSPDPSKHPVRDGYIFAGWVYLGIIGLILIVTFLKWCFVDE